MCWGIRQPHVLMTVLLLRHKTIIIKNGCFLVVCANFWNEINTNSSCEMRADRKQSEGNIEQNRQFQFGSDSCTHSFHCTASVLWNINCYTHAVFFFHENDALHCIKMFWDVDSNIIYNLNNKWDCLCADCVSFNGLANFGRNLLTLVNLLVELNNGFKLKANDLVIRYTLHANLIWTESNPMSYLLLFSSPPQ